MTVMPMFPLGSVLMPGGLLTLHVFEPRYRALVQTCLESGDHEFGVVLIDRGSEVGGGDVRRDAGTVARMVQVGETPDGRYAVVAVGTRRIQVRTWLPDDPYPQALVDEWVDEPGEAPMADEIADVIEELASRSRRAAALALELGDEVGAHGDDISEDPLVASYQLASLAPLGAADRYDLLCARGARARLAALARQLDDVEAVLQFRLGG
jgi:hypothetical protein